jgi:PAS domain S-box-containing protein
MHAARDISEHERAEQKFRILSETAGELLASDNPLEIVHRLCMKVMSYLDCQAFFNFVVDQKAGRLHLNAYAGIPEKTAAEIEWLDYGSAVCGCAARDGKRIICESIPDTPDPRTSLIKSYGIEAYACHPLLAGGKVIGTLSFGTKTRPKFTAGEIALMKTVADQVAVAMERMQTQDALRESEGRVRRKLESILSPQGDVGDLELGDIFDGPALQSLLEDFHKLAHMPMSILDLKGRMLVGVGWQDICTRFHRAHPETCSHCVESDLELTRGIGVGEFRRYKCRNNMWDAATPILVGGRHVGNLFMGQFFFEDEPLDYGFFRAQAGKYGFDEEEYIAALEAVPRLSRESLQTAMAFFQKFADILSKLSYSNIMLARSLAERDALMQSLSQGETRLNRAQEIAHLGSWELDMVRNELTWSDEVYRIFGLQPREFGATYEAFLAAVHPDDRAVVDAAYSDSIRDGRDTYEIEHRIVRRDSGEIRIVHEKCEHFRDESGRIIRSVGMVHDITERKQAEEKLRHRSAELETANQELESFSYSVSHDLRSPLRSIAGFSQVLIEDYHDKLNHAGKDSLDRIIAATKRMGRIIDDLLTLAHVSRTEIRRERVNLSAVAENIVNYLRNVEPERQLEFTDDEAVIAEGDEKLLRIALQNIIDNAWKFTEKQPLAKIEFGVCRSGMHPPACTLDDMDRTEEGKPVYYVRDNGIGLDMTYKAKLFNPFQRLHGQDEFSGTGIGLATVKRIINRHGGKVWLEGEAGKGVTVYFTL